MMSSGKAWKGRSKEHGRKHKLGAVKAERGVLFLPIGGDRMRMVTHYGIERKDITYTLEQLRQMGADMIIAVDVQTEFNGLHASPDAEQQRFFTQWALMVETLRACLALMVCRLTEHKLAQAPPEVLIKPALSKSVTVLGSFNHPEEIIAAGEAAAMADLSQIMRWIQPDTERFDLWRKNR